MTAIDLAYRLLDSEDDLLKHDDQIAMTVDEDQAEDEDADEEAAIGIYELRGVDVSRSGEHVTLHLEQVSQLSAMEVEQAYWEKYSSTPPVSRFVESSGEKSVAYDADT